MRVEGNCKYAKLDAKFKLCITNAAEINKFRM